MSIAIVRRLALAGLACVASACVAFAHPGHDEGPTGPHHLFRPVPRSALRKLSTDRPDRTESAHGDAREAVDALIAEAKSSEPELEAATDAMVAAVGATQQAIEEGQAQVTQAVGSLKDTMLRLLADAQQRLDQTYKRLDDVRSEQEKAVDEATSTLDAELRKLQQELQQRLETEVQQALDPELQAVEGALAEMGQQVSKLQGEVDSTTQEMVEQLTAVAERIPTLQSGVQQVKQAAEQVNIGW